MTIVKSAAWSIIILSLSIPLAELGLMVMRVLTNQPLSDNAAGVIDGITKIVGGGVISIISIIVGYNIKNRNAGQNFSGESGTSTSVDKESGEKPDRES